MQRRSDLIRFYRLIDQLDESVGGKRRLRNCVGRMDWPQRGVYFFFEEGEHRSDTGHGLRVVRVGTHALTSPSKSTLWKRLSQHQGTVSTGGGNHRGSIFREIVGSALAEKDGISVPTWGQGNTADRKTRDRELPHERRVSDVICAMPFLWVEVGDKPGPKSKRGYIERNAIAMLSNSRGPEIDPASLGWLGHSSDRDKVRRSGLWNQNHVDDDYEPEFLDDLKRLIS